MTAPLQLGATAAGDPVSIDLDQLLGGHACAVANSRGGKSQLIRRLVEVSHGRVPQIILDRDDEYYTLRARHDFVIAGGDGADAPATLDNAAALAIAALESNFSLIVQLNDLGEAAPEFVGLFLNALIDAPRRLWRPLLVVVDEAHRFAPQDGRTAASAGVKALTGQGLKRGYSALLASQRIAKIDADVRGDVTNWMLGRVGQALDRNTMADALGLSAREGREKLRSVEARHFWGFGPAIANEPVLFRTDDVETTPVHAGQAKLPTPPAPEALREILAGLAAASAPPAPVPRSGSGGLTDPSIPADPIEAYQVGAAAGEMLIERDREIDRMKAQVFLALQDRATAIGIARNARAAIVQLAKDVAVHLRMLDDMFDREKQVRNFPEIPAAVAVGTADEGEDAQEKPSSAVVAPSAKAAVAKSRALADGSLNPIAQAILANLRLIWPAGLTWAQAAQMVDRSPISGPFYVAKRQLLAGELVQVDGERVLAADGQGDGTDRKTTFDIWLATLDGFAPRMFIQLSNAGMISREQLGERMGGVSTKSGPWYAGLKQLRERGLILEIGNELKLADPLPGERAHG